MKEYRVVGKGRSDIRVVIAEGVSKQVAKATAVRSASFTNVKVQSRTVTEWEDV